MDLKQTLALPLVFAACGAPENSRPLTEDETAYIAEVIDRGRENLSILGPVLEHTPPFFDVHGGDISNNTTLVDQINTNMGELHDRLDDGKIVVGFDEFFHHRGGELAGGVAFGYNTEGVSVDNYIVLPEDPGTNADSDWKLRPTDAGLLLHEETHYDFGGHKNHIDLKKPNPRTLESYVIKEKDAPYLSSMLADAAHMMTYYHLSKEYFRTIFDRAVDRIEGGFNTPQNVYDLWKVNKSAAKGETTSCLWLTFDHDDLFLLTNHGLTREAYEAYISENIDSLTELNQQRYQEIIDRLVENYPGQIVVQ